MTVDMMVHFAEAELESIQTAEGKHAFSVNFGMQSHNANACGCRSNLL
jgi:hypothetical protein